MSARCPHCGLAGDRHYSHCPAVGGWAPAKPAMHPFDAMTEPELQRVFHDLAERIKYSLPKGTGFVCLASPLGPGGVAQYVSNVERADAIKWMKETIARWEAGDFVPRAGGPINPTR